MSGKGEDEPEKVMVDLGGDELHRLVQSEFPEGKEPSLTPELIVSSLKAKYLPPFWPIIEELARDCDEVLAREGFPKAAELVASGADGQWRYQEQHIEPLTDCWYAAEIGNLCWHVSQDKAATHELQLRRIMEIGVMVNDSGWREKYKGHTVRGIGTLQAAKDGAEKRRELFEPQTQAVLAEMGRLVEQGHSIKRAAALTAQRGIGKSEVANRALWYQYPTNQG
jgi:hypothetical protein